MLAFKFSNDRIILSIKDEKHNNPGSSSGRTKDSGSFNGGSNPSPGVLKRPLKVVFFVRNSQKVFEPLGFFRVAQNPVEMSVRHTS